MKKLIFFLFTLIAIQNLCSAAFPVLISDNPLSVTAELPIEGGDNAAKLSMIFTGIAIVFNILVFSASGWGALFPIFFAAVFYVAAIIFGFIGLRSKTKKWQAIIGLIPGLLVLLALLISTGSTGDPDTKD